MEPSRELDEVVASLIEPKPTEIPEYAYDNTLSGQVVQSPGNMWRVEVVYEEGDNPKWCPRPFSINIGAAFDVVKYINDRLVPFHNTDGSFRLVHMDWSSHNGSYSDGLKKYHCDTNLLPEWEEVQKKADAEDKLDPFSWSCHFHVGSSGQEFWDSGKCPRHWKQSAKFCSRGCTAPHAICLAAIKALKG